MSASEPGVVVIGGDGDPRLRALGWRHLYTGKVRSLYEHDSAPGRLLVVASDRVSAFDHVLEPAIPGKGSVLTQLSLWWFTRIGMPNHVAAAHPSLGGDLPDDLAGKSMLVHRLDMFPIEAVVRGYLTGSGWREYQRDQTVCGVALPPGLVDGDRLPEPIYTPAYKAPMGEHDENITFEQSIDLIGEADARELRDRSIDIFRQASEIAESKGLLLADTKFEFGRDPASGEIVLADEVLTPDSSRYWDHAVYAAGGPGRLESYDKQIVRDWLATHWNRSGPPPELPEDVVQRTAARYRELRERLEG